MDFKRQILDLAIEICSTNRFVARLKNYADDQLVATGRALRLDPTVDHSLNHSLALVIQGDYALLANRLDEVKARFVEAHRLLPSLKTETTEDDRARLDLVVSIEKRMETLQSRRGGSLH